MPETPEDPFVGRTVGKVRLERRIGQGGMGAVYVGEHVTLQKRMAVKILPISPTTQETEVHRFLREARTAARLEHPNIIQVFDVDQGEGFYYLVMQYVPGKTLSRLVKEKGRLPWPEALRIGLEVARALRVAHEFDPPVVHRDIKPGNIMIGADGSVKVLDFGLVRVLDNEEDLTASGHIVGTAAYMAPENVDGDSIDHRSDLYSLGVTLFVAITGAKPFAGKTPMQILYRHVNEPPPRPTALVPDLPAPVEAFLLRLLAKKPGDRHPSAREVIEEATRLLADPRASEPVAKPAAPRESSDPSISSDSLPPVDPRRLLVGQRAVEKGWITRAQLEEALSVQDQTRPTLPLGRVLLRLGYLTAPQLRALLKSQGLELEMPTPRQGIRVRDTVFGKLVGLLGMAEPEKVNQALKEQAARIAQGVELRVGDILIERGVLTPEQVVEVLAYQRKTIFRCSGCGGHFNRKNHVAGELVVCPKCGSENTLPDPKSLEATTRMDEIEVRLRRLIEERRAVESSAPAQVVAPPEPPPEEPEEEAPEEPAAPPRRPPPEAPRTGPFLGGEIPRRQAAEILARALEGPAPLGLVLGASGVGKTRFGQEVQLIPGGDRFACLVVSPASGGGPFATLSALLPALADLAQAAGGDLGARAAAWGPILLALSPELGGRAWFAGVAPAERAETAAAASALAEFVLAVASARPIALYFDDAPSLAPEVWRVLVEVVRRASGGLAIYATGVPGKLDRLVPVRELAGEDRTSEIRLRPIPEGFVRPFVQYLLGPPAVAESLVREVAFITGGVGRHIQDFVAIGRRKGFVFPEENRWTTDLDSRTRYVEDCLPERLEEELLARAREMPPLHQRVLGHLALMAAPVTLADLNRVGLIPGSQLSVILADLGEKRLLVKRAADRTAVFTLTSRRVREAYARTLPEKEAHAVHERLARHFEKVAGEGAAIEPALLAHHFEGAGIQDRALEYLLAAGEKALAGNRVEEAIDLLGRAEGVHESIEAAGKGKKGFLSGLFAKGGDRSRVHRLLGQAHLKTGLDEKALAAFGKALETLPAKNAPEAAEIHRGMGIAEIQLGRFAAAEKHLVAATAGRGTESDAEVDCQMGRIRLYRDQYDAAREILERARAGLQAGADPERLALVHHELGRCHYMAGRWAEAETEWTREREILNEKELDFFLPRNLGSVARLRGKRGRLLGALELLERARIFSSRTGNHEVEPALHCELGLVHLLRGEVPRAFQELQGGLEKAEALHQPDRTARLLQGIARALFQGGRIDEAIGPCSRAQEIFESLQFRRGLGENYHLRGQIALAAGDAEMAGRYFEFAMKELKALGAPWRLAPLLVSIHQIRRLLGQDDASARALDEGERIARAMDDRVALADVYRARAGVSLDHGDEPGSEQFMDRAAAALKEG